MKPSKLFTLLLILSIIPLSLSGQSSLKRPEGPMKTWSKAEFDNFIKAMEERRRLNKSLAHEDRKFATHDGNKIRTLFYNYGSIGRPNTEPSMEWPAYSGHGYAYEFGPLVGVEVVDVDSDTVWIFSDGMLDGGDSDPTGGSNWWGWEPLPGYAAPDQESIAMSNDPDSWGDNFPIDDEGYLLWPGQFGDGIITADLESYFVMDDRWNAEFEYYPSPSDSSLRGTGVTVEVRGYQYAASVAEDIIFFLYEVTNTSEKTIDKVVLGMIGDPHIGGAGDFSDDFAGFVDNDGIDSFTGEEVDVTGMVYCWDKQGSGNDYGISWDELGWLGYKFLESPGVAIDGIDNDNDGFTDESQYDSIDNDGDWHATDEEAVADTAEARDWWNTKMWNGIDDDGDGRIDDWGDLDGKSDDLNENGVPDEGEPDFELSDVDESDMIGLTSFWAPIYGVEEAGMDDVMWRRMTPGTFAGQTDIAQDADNVFIFGSGYFTLEPGESQKFSIAVLMGQNKDDLFSNAKVADWIYRLGFQFTKPPDKPTVTAVTGDKKVTLYWDRNAEASVDPVNGEDFEGYKLYRSTVKGDWGQEITNNQGISVGYVPIAQFDLDDDIEGPHQVPSAEGYHMDMGDDTGLSWTYIDTPVINGLTYYYAITAYDKGSAEGNLPPLECSKNLGDINVVSVTPNAPAAGYIPPNTPDPGLEFVTHDSGAATGEIIINVLNPEIVPDNWSYEVQFTIDGNKTYYSVANLETTADTVTIISGQASLSLENIVPGSVSMSTVDGSMTFEDTTDFTIDYESGTLTVISTAIIEGTSYIVTYNYYPLYQSSYINGEPLNPVFNGMQILAYNDDLELLKDSSGWISGDCDYIPKINLYSGGTLYPADFEIQWQGSLGDSVSQDFFFGISAPFIIWNVTEEDTVRYVITEDDGDKEWDPSEPIILLPYETGLSTSFQVTFTIDSLDIDTTVVNDTTVIYDTTIVAFESFEAGDVVGIYTLKPFADNDIYRFTTSAARTEQNLTKNDMSLIAVVPNPYVAASSLEATPPQVFTAGRGERRVDFIHLPEECTIRIYTMVGEHVRTLTHTGTVFEGTESWDLLNKDGHDIAPGIYIYHIETPEGFERVGRLAIIK